MKKILANFSGNIVTVGFGSIGQGVLPLLLRHLGVARNKITIITGDERGEKIAEQEGVAFRVIPLNQKNYRQILTPLLGGHGFLVNLSVDVSSIKLMELCQELGALYLDTCIEPWPGGYSDKKLSLAERTNYALREQALALQKKYQQGTTAVMAHGANPGIISHFLKQALVNIAKDTGAPLNIPKTKTEWAQLAQQLGVKTIHIAEYDSQVSSEPKKLGRFENTWSADGFVSEGVLQPCELGWGTHEKELPADGKEHEKGSRSSIYLDRPGSRTLVRTWTPSQKQFFGRVVTHHESIAIADFFTLKESAQVVYRPTVHYAYRPCDSAMLSLEETLGNGATELADRKILLSDITHGMDELGVLIMGHPKGAYWYGSQLTIEDARKLAPYQNATGLQVTAGVLGAMVWAIENPHMGVVEADDLDYARLMDILTPYMGRMYGEYTNWTPLENRNSLFPQNVDESDPWQFKNFRV